MGDVVNFSAGPSILPKEVLDSLSNNMRSYRGNGLSLLEMSHRGDVYGEVHESCIALLRELMELPDSHEVILLGGGATLQFSMVPMNLLEASSGRTAAYVMSGAWAKKAVNEGRKQGLVRVVYNGSSENFVRLPHLAELKLSGEEAYLHITTNETIGGLQWPDGFWKELPGTDKNIGGVKSAESKLGDIIQKVPLVADASSDILSRTMDFSRFGLLYAGAQKNLGPAGVTLVVIRRDLLERCPQNIGSYLSYKVHADTRSLYNTPPVFSVWAMKLVLEWLKAEGGLEKVEKRNAAQAETIYRELEDSDGFYRCHVQKEFRSRMNVVWNVGCWVSDSVWEPDTGLEAAFLNEANQAGLVGLKGHRSVGGIRASIYNAMTDAGVDRLVSFIQDFRRRRG